MKSTSEIVRDFLRDSAARRDLELHVIWPRCPLCAMPLKKFERFDDPAGVAALVFECGLGLRSAFQKCYWVDIEHFDRDWEITAGCRFAAMRVARSEGIGRDEVAAEERMREWKEKAAAQQVNVTRMWNERMAAQKDGVQ